MPTKPNTGARRPPITLPLSPTRHGHRHRGTPLRASRPRTIRPPAYPISPPPGPAGCSRPKPRPKRQSGPRSPRHMHRDPGASRFPKTTTNPLPRPDHTGHNRSGPGGNRPPIFSAQTGTLSQRNPSLRQPDHSAVRHPSIPAHNPRASNRVPSPANRVPDLSRNRSGSQSNPANTLLRPTGVPPPAQPVPQIPNHNHSRHRHIPAHDLCASERAPARAHRVPDLFRPQPLRAPGQRALQALRRYPPYCLGVSLLSDPHDLHDHPQRPLTEARPSSASSLPTATPLSGRFGSQNAKPSPATVRLAQAIPGDRPARTWVDYFAPPLQRATTPPDTGP